jgi:hypothetical protein
MKIEISDGLMRNIVDALQSMPYKTAAPALDELQRAINSAQAQVQVPTNGSERVTHTGG